MAMLINPKTLLLFPSELNEFENKRDLVPYDIIHFKEEKSKLFACIHVIYYTLYREYNTVSIKTRVVDPRVGGSTSKVVNFW